MVMHRRDFVRASAAGAGLWMLAGRALRAEGLARDPLRIGFLGDPRSTLGLGVQLGIEEAQHAAALFGGGVTLAVATPAATATPEQIIAAALRLVDHDAVAAVIGDVESRNCGELFAVDARQRVYMNVGCAADDLRNARCRRFAFHIAASDAMRHDARLEAHVDAAAPVELWDARLVKFGADTLNGRFRARFKTDMTSAAWAGWFAVKALWESSLRARSTEAAAIAAFLSRDTSQFDGHKGTPLSFRTWDHQLRQPLYVLAPAGTGSKLLGVPMTTADESSRAALDRLGSAAGTSTCKMPQ